MKLPVSLQRLDDYQPDRVRAALIELLAPLGGMATFVAPGRRVLVKPNMLAGKAPERAVTTHPEIVRQVILLAQEAGGVVSIGDSPGIGSPLAVARKCGILQVVEETGATFVPFVEAEAVTIGAAPGWRVEIARPVLDAEVIINLPKLKTHQMMGFTGAVKNMYGAVAGLNKLNLHLQAGDDPARFAGLLLDLAERFPPALSIIDGVVGMEGNGPGSGDPVAIGALLASAHALALDTAATALVGLTERQVWTQRVARQGGRPGSRREEIEIFGAQLEEFNLPRFRPARSTAIGFGLPAPLQRRLRRALTARPEILSACVRCGDCVRHCPPQAMTLACNGVTIDDRACIRCFCCQELCPHRAIGIRQGVLLRVAGLLGGGSRHS